MNDKSEQTKCVLCGKTEGARRSFSSKVTYGEVFCEFCEVKFEMVSSRVRSNLEQSTDSRSWFKKNFELLTLPLGIAFWYFVLKYLDEWLNLGLFN